LIKDEADAWAKSNGYEETDEIRMRSGETAYLLQPADGHVIGIPRYIRHTEQGFIMSNYEESMALFDEPDYMRNEDG
jgi:hypothetical protein